MTTYYLYVKTHKITRLKYLGHTRQPNPYTYKGSGKYWKNHIKKHGYHVRTVILLKTDSIKELEVVARFFSEFFDVVSSENWANLIPETGSDIDGINETGKNLYGLNGKTPNIKDNFKKGLETKRFLAENDPEWVRQTSNNISKGVKNYYANSTSHWLGRSHKKESLEKQKNTLKSIKHQQGCSNSQYGTMWIYSLEEKRNRKIPKDDPIPEGWYKGRKMSF